MAGRIHETGLWRAGAAAIAATGLALTLGGCGSVSQITDSFTSGGGIFGSSKPENGWTATVTEANMLTAARDSSGASDVRGATGGDCPAVLLSSTAEATITQSAPGGSGAPGDTMSVMHRGEISRTARECSPAPGGVVVKYGLSGRVLLGPQGKPGTVTLPVKVTVVDGARKTVKTEVIQMPVTVGSEESAGYFSLVREIVVPVPAGAAPGSFRVFVAFDRSGRGAS